jgi:hypothetical protein
MDSQRACDRDLDKRSVKMGNDRFLTIHFIDGSEKKVTFPKQGGNPLLLAKRVQEAIDSRQLAIEIDGQLFVFPMSNVKYLQMSPSPDELPETVILGGALNDE